MSETRRIILDAGPALTFCAANKQQILHDTLRRVGELKAPERVHTEILNKAKPRSLFAAARNNWLGLVDHGHIQLLSDEPTAALEAAVLELSGTPFDERVRHGKDLGELMVMAHAIVLRDQGCEVIVLIDEWRAQATATRLGLRVLDTHRVLISAARNGLITDRAHMRKTYAQLRIYDDGLVDIAQTSLLSRTTWAPQSGTQSS